MQRQIFFPVSARPHSFRQALPQRVLAAEPQPEPEIAERRRRARRNEDVRLFLLSFTAFFVAISSFIW